MQLTGKEILERGIITGSCKEALQQQGIDLRIKDIKIVTGVGEIPPEGKTKLPMYDHYELGYIEPGYYEVTFEEGCKIPSNCSLHLKTRSSLVRCGAIIHSGQFDAGFETDSMGAFMHVIRPIKIEKGARVAQAIVFQSSDVENLYDGQWQNDKQRAS